MRKRFSFRAMTTFIVTWTFLLLIISGTVLYVSPAGRISNWTDWRLLALTKSQWQGVHTLAALVFLIGSMFHLLKFNWKVFWTYMKKRSEAGWQYRSELAISSLLVVLVLAGIINEIPPFVTIAQAGETIKNSWSTAASEPPAPHTELLSVRQVAENLKLDPEKARSILAREGVAVAALEDSLSTVARSAGLSPARIYSTLRKSGTDAHPVPGAQQVQSHPAGAVGAGLGFKALSSVAEELNLTAEEAVERLRKKKVESEPQETIRAIALRSNMKPFELVELIKTAR